MVDAADSSALSQSWVLFLELLVNPQVTGKPIALVFNKLDIANPVDFMIYKNTFNVDGLIEDMKGIFFYFGGSCLETYVPQAILNWLKCHYDSSSPLIHLTT